MEIKHYCTLFDSNYLDKGIVLCNSLNRVSDKHKLYILAMDDKCYEILNNENIQNSIIIGLSDFLDQELTRIMNERSRAEFCWTCTSYLISYVFDTFHVPACTYLDADLYFFADPSSLIDEMGECDVQIVEHRFTRKISDRVSEHKSGKYCVEFNTFKNNRKGRELLSWWKSKCIESCSIIDDSKIFGDQKYLADWGTKENVAVLKNLGGGIAPWNVGQYRLVRRERDIYLRKGTEIFKLIFYHFHNLNYIDKDNANINVFKRNWSTDSKLIEAIYHPYLIELNEIKDRLYEGYGFYPLLVEHPAKEQVHTKRLLEYLKSFSLMDVLKLYALVEGRVKRKINYKKDIINIHGLGAGR